MFKHGERSHFLKRFIQKRALALASFSISKLGNYPGILDKLISKNTFGVNKFKFYGASEVNSKVQEIITRINSTQSSENRSNATFSINSPRIPKKLAFLTIGGPESITNKILSDIGKSYSGKAIFLNQKFYGSKLPLRVDLDENFDLLSEFAPDVVFFELHTLIDSASDDTIFSKDFISRLKLELNVKICVICFDIWREFDHSYLEYWNNLVDIFVHLDQKAAKSLNEVYPMFFWPYPALNSPLPVNLNKDYGIFFQGSIREYDRRKLLSHVARISKKLNLDFTFNVFSHHTARNTPSRAHYLSELVRAKYCIGLSQKSKDHWLITFRSIEAIYSGAILIQQTGLEIDPLSTLYTPYRHYLPFNSDLELQAILFIIKHHDKDLDLISKNAMSFHFSHYSGEQLWNGLFEELFKM